MSIKFANYIGLKKCIVMELLFKMISKGSYCHQHNALREAVILLQEPHRLLRFSYLHGENMAVLGGRAGSGISEKCLRVTFVNRFMTKRVKL